MPIHKSVHPSVAIPADKTVTEYVFEHVEKFGDKLALVDGITQKEVSFKGLYQEIKRTAAGFQAKGYKKGDVIAVWSPNSPDYVTAFHAVMHAGCTLTTLNPAYTAQEVAHQLDNSGAIALLTVAPFLPRVAEARQTYKGIREVFMLGGDAAEGFPPLSSIQVDKEPTKVPTDTANDVCVLPYSSGTTGLPKGVMLTHLNVCANLAQAAAAMASTPEDTFLGVLPFFHIYGMVLIMNLSLRVGARVVTMPAFDPEPYLKNLKKWNVTVAHVAPPLVQFLAKAPIVDQFLPFPNLKTIFCGAAPLGVALSDEVQKRMKVKVVQGYGMTEMSPLAHADAHADSGIAPKLGSIGYLCPNMECKIVNPETGLEQNAGTEEQRGEMWLRGPNIMKGYHRNAKETAKDLDKDGFLHTGDIAYVDNDGVYFVVDRLKELIKTKGFQVAPAELESVLVKHDGIADAAVIGVDAAKYGGREGDGELPKAFVILQANSKLTPQQISEWLKPQVTAYKLIAPQCIDIVDSIPKSASGKILRKDLRLIEKKLPPKSKL